MYAQLRGVPSDKIKGVVAAAIEHLNLRKWADKLCGDYRSVILSSFPSEEEWKVGGRVGETVVTLLLRYRPPSPPPPPKKDNNNNK